MTDLFDSCFAGLSIRPMTEQLVKNLLWDIALSPAQIVDFGVDTDDHYRALQFIVRNAQVEGVAEDEANDLTLPSLRSLVVELDQALGNGEKLNAFVRQYAPTYAAQVRFHTLWDELPSCDHEQPEG